MAEGIFDLGEKLGHRRFVCGDIEDGIVAEALGAGGLVGNLTFANALGQAVAAVGGAGEDSAAEASAALCGLRKGLQFLEQVYVAAFVV